MWWSLNIQKKKQIFFFKIYLFGNKFKKYFELRETVALVIFFSFCVFVLRKKVSVDHVFQWTKTGESTQDKVINQQMALYIISLLRGILFVSVRASDPAIKVLIGLTRGQLEKKLRYMTIDVKSIFKFQENL